MKLFYLFLITYLSATIPAQANGNLSGALETARQRGERIIKFDIPEIKKTIAQMCRSAAAMFQNRDPADFAACRGSSVVLMKNIVRNAKSYYELSEIRQVKGKNGEPEFVFAHGLRQAEDGSFKVTQNNDAPNLIGGNADLSGDFMNQRINIDSWIKSIEARQTLMKDARIATDHVIKRHLSRAKKTRGDSIRSNYHKNIAETVSFLKGIVNAEEKRLAIQLQAAKKQDTEILKRQINLRTDPGLHEKVRHYGRNLYGKAEGHYRRFQTAGFFNKGDAVRTGLNELSRESRHVIRELETLASEKIPGTNISKLGPNAQARLQQFKREVAQLEEFKNYSDIGLYSNQARLKAAAKSTAQTLLNLSGDILSGTSRMPSSELLASLKRTGKKMATLNHSLIDLPEAGGIDAESRAVMLAATKDFDITDVLPSQVVEQEIDVFGEIDALTERSKLADGLDKTGSGLSVDAAHRPSLIVIDPVPTSVETAKAERADRTVASRSVANIDQAKPKNDLAEAEAEESPAANQSKAEQPTLFQQVGSKIRRHLEG